eukprot:1518388-Pyramimonas_sp.AAC.1
MSWRACVRACACASVRGGVPNCCVVPCCSAVLLFVCGCVRVFCLVPACYAVLHCYVLPKYAVFLCVMPWSRVFCRAPLFRRVPVILR